ncbi:MAG: radical SAM protein [Leptospiraceae bacterium]|nr:radical SAM protein [Leptospiraceae bacterium]
MSEKFSHPRYDLRNLRYNCYPLVPFWKHVPTQDEWFSSAQNSLTLPDSKISIYIHIPFCESFCSFCACNTVTTIDHSVELPYLETIYKELELYILKVPEILEAKVVELQLGGGSPNFISENNLENLLNFLFSKLKFISNPELSIEVNPNKTSKEQLEVLSKFGFKTISIGVEDFDESVLSFINKEGSFAEVKMITEAVREFGFNTVNFNLIYGLPNQTKKSIHEMMDKINILQPERVTFHEYLHVPWIKDYERLFTVQDLPIQEERTEFFELGKTLLLNLGYIHLGMEQFVKPNDELYLAQKENRLQRRFTGYTSIKPNLLLGLGVSAISESETFYHQNIKILKKYQKFISENTLPSFKGHHKTEEDRIQSQIIFNLETNLRAKILSLNNIRDRLRRFESNGDILLNGEELILTEKGRASLGEICAVFDHHLQNHLPVQNK